MKKSMIVLVSVMTALVMPAASAAAEMVGGWQIEAQEASAELGCNVPWIVLMDPTSACNMHCTGCWAAEYGHKQSLSYEAMDIDIIERNLSHVFKSGEHHPYYPEEDDVVSGDHCRCRIEIVEIRSLFRPAEY